MMTAQHDRLVLIGEDMHILNPSFQQALDSGNYGALIRMASRQVGNGAHALDLNPGPARAMQERLPGIIEAIQEQVETTFFLPAAPEDVLEQALAIHRGRACINAATADPARLDALLRIAGEHDAALVVLLTRPGLARTDLSTRLHLAMEVLEKAAEADFPMERLYLDPVFSLRSDPLAWRAGRGMPDLEQALETIALIHELGVPGINTLLALSNGTIGMPADKRANLHRRMLPLLVEAGLDAVLLHCGDRALMETAAALRKPERLQSRAA